MIISKLKEEVLGYEVDNRDFKGNNVVFGLL